MSTETRGTPCEVGPPYSVIVAALGEADAAEVVTRAAVNAAKLAPGSELHLVHVIDVPPVAEAAISGVGWTYPGAAELRERGRRHLDHFTHLACEALGRKVTGHLLLGTTTRAVVQVLDEVGADLAVIATHDGEGSFARALLGRVADGIMHKAPCSVLLVRASRGGGRRPE
ncbi:MAG TPA: universal stress protein [Polyangiaceae bacterium]|nr:universal stress protein [Polyangiaceae bacterium]